MDLRSSHYDWTDDACSLGFIGFYFFPFAGDVAICTEATEVHGSHFVFKSCLHKDVSSQLCEDAHCLFYRYGDDTYCPR